MAGKGVCMLLVTVMVVFFGMVAGQTSAVTPNSCWSCIGDCPRYNCAHRSPIDCALHYALVCPIPLTIAADVANHYCMVAAHPLGSLLSISSRVGLILRSIGFDNSTRIYIAAGDLFGGERFMKPFRKLFPHLENHSTVGPADELAENTRGLLGSAVDYMVCLLADIFMPTYDGPSNFANNVMGHRLYYGFRTIIQPDRKALAPVFIDRENGRTAGFEEAVRQVMFKTQFGGPHKRVRPESFYTNSWPECFCQMSPQNPADKCPPDNVLEVLNNKLHSEEAVDKETESFNQTDFTAK